MDQVLKPLLQRDPLEGIGHHCKYLGSWAEPKRQAGIDIVLPIPVHT